MSDTLDEVKPPSNPMPPDLIKELDATLDEYERQYAPDICNTLGIMAVKGDLMRGVLLTDPKVVPWLEEETPDADKGIARYLQETRDRIESIDADERFSVGAEVIRGEVPQFLIDSLGIDYGGQVFKRLVEKSPDGVYVVKDESLLNVLQWHNHQMGKRRERFMEKEWPRLKEDFTLALEMGVRAGWLPQVVLEPERKQALENLEVTIDDGMLLNEIGNEAFVTTYDQGSSKEVFFPQYTPRVTVNHELLHVVSGREASGNGENKHTGLYRLFKAKHQAAGKVLDEAVTEHLAHPLAEYSFKDPDDIAKRITDGFSSHYNHERRLLNVLCHGGIKPIEVKTFANAYFEDSTKLRRPALRKLKRQLAKAFPDHDVLNELGELMSEGEYTDARQALPAFTTKLALDMSKRKSDRHRRDIARQEKKIKKLESKL
jgi:hypothetical protein